MPKILISSALLFASLVLAGLPVHAISTGTGTTGKPVVTSPTTATCELGENFSYQITARNWPASLHAFGLPRSMHTDTRTGKIVGPALEAGTWKVTLEARNAEGYGYAILMLTVNPEKPIITGASSVNGRVGVEFSYKIMMRNIPTSFAASGLPPGLRIDSATGMITGIPAEQGTSDATVSATNAGGTGSGPLTFVISPAGPSIFSAVTAKGVADEPFNYQIKARNSPTSFSATGLPADLNLNSITGEITGRPQNAGIFNVTIGASNAWGTGSAILVVSVGPGKLLITSAPTASGEINEEFSYRIRVNKSFASYSAVGLPAGLSVDQASGQITGRPTEAGIFNVTIGASNTGATGSAALTITIDPETVTPDLSTPKSKLLK